jgi:HPr kinase/phosphorylase
MDSRSETVLHATAVAFHGEGLLILGAAGSGKSGLALMLMAFGARLVSDDRTVVKFENGGLWASAPPSIAGLIEARGIGILNAETEAQARLTLAVDMDKTQVARLPQTHSFGVLGQTLPCLHKVDSPYFPAAILQYLKGGIKAPT